MGDTKKLLKAKRTYRNRKSGWGSPSMKQELKRARSLGSRGLRFAKKFAGPCLANFLAMIGFFSSWILEFEILSKISIFLYKQRANNCLNLTKFADCLTDCLLIFWLWNGAKLESDWKNVGKSLEQTHTNKRANLADSELEKCSNMNFYPQKIGLDTAENESSKIWQTSLCKIWQPFRS